MTKWRVMTELQASGISGVDSAHNGYHKRIPAFRADLNGVCPCLKRYTRSQNYSRTTNLFSAKYRRRAGYDLNLTY
jgi:hypothetical protein